ncbi:MAG: AAA family ATPase [Gammaproteobacteria bacterium]|nr:AAA family ATPase [Gammaproteobacteria bacterium]
MHIRNLTLAGFRCAQRLELELHGNLNVFVGMNGAGKTSIVDASAILLSWLVNRIIRAGSAGKLIVEAAIRNGEPYASLGIVLNHEGAAWSWKLAKARKGHDSENSVSVLVAVSELARQFRSAITDSAENVNLPLFACYPVNRAVVDTPLRLKGKQGLDLLSAYAGALSGGADFRTFFQWFREREDLENEVRRDAQSRVADTSGACFPDVQLQAVRNALSSFMPEFNNLTVRRNPLRMEVEKEGKRLMINQLSDGEKCLMALIGDMARRMAILNPLRANPLEGEGIILIDEIDLHLHPKWQRMVILNLVRVFPNCQFLITTHSPHIITHVKPENLFLLSMTAEGLASIPASECYGKTVERVLEDLMGLETTRPDAVQNDLGKIYETIDSNDLETARELIGKLEKQIGEDSDLVKANVLIKRKELIGK